MRFAHAVENPVRTMLGRYFQLSADMVLAENAEKVKQALIKAGRKDLIKVLLPAPFKAALFSLAAVLLYGAKYADIPYGRASSRDTDTEQGTYGSCKGFFCCRRGV